MIATMRAKRTLAEFLNNDVKSAKTLNRLAKSYARSFSSTENQETQLGEDSEAAENEETADKQSVQSRKFSALRNLCQSVSMTTVRRSSRWGT